MSKVSEENMWAQSGKLRVMDATPLTRQKEKQSVPQIKIPDAKKQLSSHLDILDLLISYFADFTIKNNT